VERSGGQRGAAGEAGAAGEDDERSDGQPGAAGEDDERSVVRRVELVVREPA
jgi:hypothetical protein